MSEPLSREQAWTLFCEWTESESLRRHVLAVEAAMRAYARRFGEDEELWGLVGMLHDLDYERHPDLETGHPRVALKELEQLGFPPEFVRAVASHADFLEVSRDTPMEKTLYAVDELSRLRDGLRVRAPAGHPRADAQVGQEEDEDAGLRRRGRPRRRCARAPRSSGVDFDEHLAFVIAALEEHADELGLDGPRGGGLMALRIVVLEGDETGQELLEQALRVLDPDVLGLELELERFDLSLEKRRETGNEIVHEAARAMREAGFGIKAATVTPEGKDDVGSPNRILREEVDGKVIVRTGRRIPGVVGPVSGVYHPISVVRMAVDDAYGAKQWREGDEGAVDEVALPDREDHALHLPRGGRVRVPDRRADGRAGLRRAEVDGLPRLRGDAQGGDGRGGRAPPGRRVPAGADRRARTRGCSPAPPRRRW